MYNHGKFSPLLQPCIRLERGKFKLTNERFSRREKIYCQLTGKALKSGNFSHWRWHEIFTKGDLQFPKPYHIAKSEKYETFCVSNF